VRLPVIPPFVAVPLGVATVVLIDNPRALIPLSPYWPWLMLLVAAACFGLVLQLGLEDDSGDLDAGEQAWERAVRWRAAGLAYLVGALASVTYLACVWVIGRLDRAAI